LRRQLGESIGVGAAVLLQAVTRAFAQLIERPASAGHTDDRHVQLTTPGHRLQRRKDLLVSQIAGGAEENQRIRTGCCHRLAFLMASSAHRGGVARAMTIMTALRADRSVKGAPRVRRMSMFGVESKHQLPGDSHCAVR
jgi:hypothetical protein